MSKIELETTAREYRIGNAHALCKGLAGTEFVIDKARLHQRSRWGIRTIGKDTWQGVRRYCRGNERIWRLSRTLLYW